MAAKKQSKPAPDRRIVNKKARHDYHILETVEAGIELQGTEVKSLRAGQVKIGDAYARIRDGEAHLVGANFAQYKDAAGDLQHDPLRDRKLLLHRRQIRQLDSHVRQKGKTIVPLAMYFRRGWAKVELGVAVGKRSYDKREQIKRRDQRREIDRELSRRRRRR